MTDLCPESGVAQAAGESVNALVNGAGLVFGVAARISKRVIYHLRRSLCVYTCSVRQYMDGSNKEEINSIMSREMEVGSWYAISYD
jgi:hypothetical protein